MARFAGILRRWLGALRKNSSPSMSRRSTTRKCSTEPSFTAQSYLDFTNRKIEAVQRSTESAPPPTFHQTDHRMPDLQPFSTDVLCQLLLSSLPKLCELDPLLLPFLIKDYLDELLPFLLLLCNTALGDEAHPASQKRALVFPSLKCNGLDADDKKQLKLHLLHNSEH